MRERIRNKSSGKIQKDRQINKLREFFRKPVSVTTYWLYEICKNHQRIITIGMLIAFSVLTWFVFKVNSAGNHETINVYLSSNGKATFCITNSNLVRWGSIITDFITIPFLIVTTTFSAINKVEENSISQSGQAKNDEILNNVSDDVAEIKKMLNKVSENKSIKKLNLFMKNSNKK